MLSAWIALLAVLVPLAPGTPLVNGGSPATWSPTGAMRAAHYKHTATLLPTGLVLVAGGAAIGAPPARPELYDPRTGTWAVTGRMHGLHALDTATLLRDGTVLVAGGSFGSPTAEVYDPRSGA